MNGPRRAPSIITIANEQVSIVKACRIAGVDLPHDSDSGRSMKVYCPFGALHSDGGTEKAMRVYPDSNHAWCFACQSFFTPVKIVADATKMDWAHAAVMLLDSIGFRPATLVEEWQAVVEHRQDPDPAQLAGALKLYCQRVIPGWRSRQFDRAEASLLTSCLKLLDLVRTDEEAQLWLNTAKTVMSREFAG